MATGKFVAYYRVSTKRQGQSGLGLEAQKEAVARFLNGGSWTVVAEFTEVESGSRDDRPQLAKAIATSRLYGARLVIAKLDRLSRDVHFLTGLEKAGVQFVAADMPEANEMVVHMMAVVAQAERKMISARTKAALAEKRKWYASLTPEQRAALEAEGKRTRLGGPGINLPAVAKAGASISVNVRKAKAAARAADLAPVLQELGPMSLRSMAAALTARGIPTPRGSTKWNAAQVQRVLKLI